VAWVSAGLFRFEDPCHGFNGYQNGRLWCHELAEMFVSLPKQHLVARQTPVQLVLVRDYCRFVVFAAADMGPPFDDDQPFLELFKAVSNGLDEESKLPLSLWLLEDPDSPVALPGAACLDLHDCLHILLNRGYSTADEAFVVGFSMGNDRRCRRWHQRLLAVVSHRFYPRVYRHSRLDLWQFWRGVWLGQRTLPLMQFTPQDFLRLGERLGEIRQALGLQLCSQP
tara:strand:- start:303 stop:977 length:675 start_codon:yes stop_codon:yes gene_type:complete